MDSDLIHTLMTENKQYTLEHCKTWSSLGFHTWSPAFSQICKQSIPPTVHLEPEPVFFADTGIIHHPKSNHFQNSSNNIFSKFTIWSTANKLALNLDRANFMKFSADNKLYYIQYRL
jgi:hypothetical protein